MTITINGLEHELRSYNDDNGYGVTECGMLAQPWDLGPNDGNEAKCVDCKAKVQPSQPRTK